MTRPSDPFFNIYTQGFLRAAVATPHVWLADPDRNAHATLELATEAAKDHAALCVFPELGLSGYAIDDLFQQEALLQGVVRAIERIAVESHSLACVLAVGAPLRHEGRLYNCGVLIHRGRVLGVVPKSFLPNYREFYERRHFASGIGVTGQTIRIGTQTAPFGTDLLFAADDLADAVFHMEICEDVWVPQPPSSAAALAGATVLINLSASNATIGKADYRHALCQVQSARCVAAYLYSAAGRGESTTDLAWDGQATIHEMGEPLAASERFAPHAQIATADLDLMRISQERTRLNTFGDGTGLQGSPAFRRIAFTLNPERHGDLGLRRQVDRFPYVPDDETRLDALCFEAFNIQAHGLRQRLEASGIKRIVLGVSGGLDSAQALLVAALAFDQLNLPRTNILAYTLPAFATTVRTKSNALSLMQAMGVSAAEIDITTQCRQMLADIGHPFAKGEKLYDVTFENVQAGARTSLLFRLANQNNALVLGTGDLSELALGWSTYGVGDHMSHYNVNASVPKTLIQHLIRWVARKGRFGAEAAAVLEDILATDITPELVPGGVAGSGAALQRTEDVVGPYALQDFNLYYTTRFGFAPYRIAFLAFHAWRDAALGLWPANLSPAARVAYDLVKIKHWLGVFVRRFFETSQFKRSCVPNGPKVSSGGSLSPRGDWRAPSDSSAALWLADVARIPQAPL